MPDLAELVCNHMASFATGDALSGYEVYRNTEDGTAAVKYHAGVIPAYTSVLRQTLPIWARRLREHGFTVEIEVRDDRGETNVPQWLRITEWAAPKGGNDA